MSESIHQEVVFSASPGSLYQALLDSSKFSEITGGAPATIESEVGGAFSLFGGMVVGRNIELIPDKRIVQAWRATDWDEGVYSIIKFELTNKGEETHLSFDQSGFPAEAKEQLEGGWHKMYWEPLKANIV